MDHEKRRPSDTPFIYEGRNRDNSSPVSPSAQKLSMEVSNNVFTRAKPPVNDGQTERLLPSSVSRPFGSGSSSVSLNDCEGNSRGNGNESDQRPARNLDVASRSGSLAEGQGKCAKVEDQQSSRLGLDSREAQSSGAGCGFDRWQEVVLEQMGAGRSRDAENIAAVLESLALIIPHRCFLADLNTALTNYPSMPVLPLTPVGVAALAGHIYDTLTLQGWLLPEFLDGSVVAFHQSDAIELVDAAIKSVFRS